MIAMGFDPGGSSSGFGCGYLDSERAIVKVATVYSVDQALSWVKEIDVEPDAVGIDTLLFWQSTRSGWRGADEYLRKRYPRQQNSVISSNGLYGSMAVQGAVLASRLRARWPHVRLTETHPKMLWAHLFPDVPYPRSWQGGVPGEATKWLRGAGLSPIELVDDHQFDAVLSAWAALQAYSGAWTNDLAGLLAKDQQGPNISVVNDIHYFWPN